MNKNLLWQNLLKEFKEKGKYDPRFYQIIPTKDKFYGFKKPQLTRIAARILKQVKEPEQDLIGLINFFWKKNIWEAKKVAIEMLYLSELAPVKKIKTVENWIDNIDNWEIADSSAMWVLGRAILNDSTLAGTMLSWSKAENKWKRRMSAVSLVIPLHNDKVCNEVYRIIKNLIRDPEKEVQMAVGWLIREAGKKETNNTISFLKKLNLNHPDAKKSIRWAAKKSIKTMPEKLTNFLESILKKPRNGKYRIWR